MKLSRALSTFLPPSSSEAGKWLLLRAATGLQGALLSTGTKAKPATRKGSKTEGQSNAVPEITTHAPTKDDKEAAPQLPKPREIPWQAKVANTVHLIGHLGTPVQLGVAPDGGYTAVSVLLHEKTHDLPQFWIPIVFQGDLAQIAACNLREKDHVYVNGQLTGGSQLVDSNPDTKIQVMVDSISYVLDVYSENRFRNTDKLVNASAQMKDAPFGMEAWNDLFANPHHWWDYRKKGNKRSGMFKHKESGQSLEINEDTPEWILSQLDNLTFTSMTSNGANKFGESLVQHWNDLIEKPESWWDNREDKLNGKITQRHPDFAHKVTRKGLWLDSAPDWVLPKLKGLEVSRESSWQNEAQKMRMRLTKKEESWRNLLENPEKWLDKRSNKSKSNAPDFKHKETGEGLWLDSTSTPKWVLDKLPATNVENQ